MLKLVATCVLALTLVAPAVVDAQPAEHAPAQPAAHQPADQHGAAPAEHGAEEHSTSIWQQIGPYVNFLILVGLLYYLFRAPVAEYLETRRTGIRKDLVEAAELRTTATAQLAEIDRKVKALPGEIEALRQRGAEEIAAEEQRIAAQAASERERLLEQTRREIDVQLRIAKRDLLEHAADLSVQLATDRIKQNITPADQDRLVDRYLGQLRSDDGRPN
jgi:F-type H+-transporting ATPase subunit b